MQGPRPEEDELQDVSLEDEDPKGGPPQLPRGSRPECLKSGIHECLFVALAAFAAASPIFLQRSIVVVADSMVGALQMTPAELAWATAGPG